MQKDILRYISMRQWEIGAMPSNKIRHNWGDSTSEINSVYSMTNTCIEDTIHGWDDSKYDDWMYRIEVDTRPRHIWLTDWLYNEIKIETDPHRVRLLNTDMSLVDVLDRRIFQYSKDLVDIAVGEDQANPMFHITIDSVKHEIRIVDDRDNLILLERDKDRIYLKTKQDSYVDMKAEDISIHATRSLDLSAGGGVSINSIPWPGYWYTHTD